MEEIDKLSIDSLPIMNLHDEIWSKADDIFNSRLRIDEEKTGKQSSSEILDSDNYYDYERILLE